MDKIKITHRKFLNDIQLLADQISIAQCRMRETFSGIYGIKRGGYVVAVYLSHRLNLPILNEPTSGCVVVDELVDSGKTLKKYENYHTAVLYRKDCTEFEADFYVKTINKWIVFDWETDETSRRDYELPRAV